MRVFKYIGLIILILIVVFLFKAIVLRDYATFNFLFTPDGFFQKMVDIPIDLSKEGKSNQFEFKNKYPGDYRVTILVEKPVKLFEQYVCGFDLLLEVESSKRSYKLNIIPKEFIALSGDEPFSHGVIVKVYSVPEDLPRNKPLKGQLVIKKPDPMFEQKYGKTRLSISKFSDE